MPDASAAPSAPVDPTAASILKSAEAIALSKFLPVLNSFLTNVQANPSIENLMAQGPAFVVQLQAQLPNLQQAETAFIAGQVQILLNNATAAAPPSSASATPPAVSSGAVT